MEAKICPLLKEPCIREKCVKTNKGLYCSHRDGRPKVTNGGWCIDMQEKED